MLARIYLNTLLTASNKYDIQFACSDLLYQVKQNKEAFDLLKTKENEIIQGLEDKNRHRRLACISLLKILGKVPLSGIDKLITLVRHPNFHEYYNASEALLKIASIYNENPTVIDTLTQSIRELENEITIIPDTEVRQLKRNKEAVKRLITLKAKLLQEKETGWQNMQQILLAISNWVNSNADWIDTIFIYGSRLVGTYHKNSDLDLAVMLVDKKAKTQQWQTLSSKIEQELSAIIPHRLDIQWFQSSYINPGIYEGLSKGCTAIRKHEWIGQFQNSKGFKEL